MGSSEWHTTEVRLRWSDRLVPVHSLPCSRMEAQCGILWRSPGHSGTSPIFARIPTMSGRTVCVRLSLLALSLTVLAAPVHAQTAGRLPERAVRRDIPITNTIRRAYAAGTRDSTGRPGRSYWQIRTDYTINARLDATTSRLTGRETVVLHNSSPDSLGQIQLRLDPNIFLGNTPQAATWVPSEVTDGMVITR